VGDRYERLRLALDLLLLFTQSIALAIVLAYGLRTVALRIGPGHRFTSQALSGLIFGLLAVLWMQLPLEIRPGVLVDLRNLAVFLAGPFGGGPAALVAGALAGGYRLYLGGEGALAGTGSVLTAAVLGCLIGLRYGRLETWRTAGLAGLALFVTTIPWFFAIGGPASGWPLVQVVALPYAVFYIGGAILLSGLLTSEQHRSWVHEQLRLNEQRFRDVAELASDWFWEMDAQGRFTYVSPRLLELSGFGAERFLGATRRDLIAEIASQDLRRYEEAVARHQPFRNLTYALRTADGRLLQLSASGKPLFDKDGRFAGYRGSGRDLTDEVRDRRALEAARREAEDASRAKSEFLATMSHELRTPLNAIIGFSEVMKNEMMGPLGTAVYKGYSGDIHASAMLLLSLVNDVLDMAKIEAGRMQLDKAPHQLAGIVAPMVHLLEARAAGLGIRLSAQIQERMQEAFVDERAVKQILLNLLSNALKYTAPGGEVSVTARYDDTVGHILEITDTGAGIPPDALARVTEPFYQVKGRNRTSGDGTGLGLALCKALAEAHGGRLVVESCPGEGTTVQIILPMLAWPQQDGQVAAESASLAG
jgi:PAS domain S-box-containing protein